MNAFLNVELDIPAATAYLSKYVDIARVENAIIHCKKENITGYKAIVEIGSACIEATLYSVNGLRTLTTEQAIDIGATFLDTLVNFTGILGRPLEAVDYAIIRALLDAIYEVVRMRKIMPDSAAFKAYASINFKPTLV